jgi:T5SS/PEP-CTERM-associated repeat protein
VNGTVYIGGTNSNDSNSTASNNIVTISSNSALSNSDALYILSSSNQLNVYNSSTNSNGSDFHIYYGSNNVVTVSNSSLVIDNLLFLGGTNNTNLGTSLTSSNNTITINSSIWSNVYSGNGTNTITSSGNTINVTNGSILYFRDDTCLGYNGSNNSINVSGNSSLNCDADFFIGTNGSTDSSGNSVNVNSGATWNMSNNIINIGSTNGGSGSISVSGIASQINASNIIVYNGTIYADGGGTNSYVLGGGSTTLTLGTNNTPNATLALSTNGNSSLEFYNFNNGNSTIGNINPNSQQQIIYVANEFANISKSNLTSVLFCSNVSLDNELDPIVSYGKTNGNFNSNVNLNFTNPNFTGSGMNFSMGSGNLYVQITNTASLTISNQYINETNAFSLSELTMIGGAFSVSNNGDVSVSGTLTASNSPINVNSSGTLTVSGTLTASNSPINVNNGSIYAPTIQIGSSSNGTNVEISNGGVVNCYNFVLGYNASSNAALLSNASLSVTNDLILGSNGSYNTLQIENVNSNQFTASTVILGFNSSDNYNALTILNSTNNLTNQLVIGTNGNYNSVTVNSASLNIDNTNLNNANPVLDRSLIVGLYGSGNQLTITNSGTVFSSLGVIGYGTNSSNNTATVNGTGSIWTNTNGFYVGFQGGNNSLLITNGGNVLVNNGTDSPYTYVGLASSSSSNTVVITGSNSMLSNQGALNVGYLGSYNTIYISNGGTLIDSNVSNNLSYAAILGTYSNYNSVTINTNSLWTNNGNLYIGYYGSYNSVTNNGGTLVASDIYIGYSTNHTGAGTGSNNTLIVYANSTVKASNMTVATNSSLTNLGSISISSWLTNNGYITNGGTITVGEFANYGTYVGSAVITNPSTFDNLGTMILPRGTTTITGHVVEHPGSTIVDEIAGPSDGQYGRLHVANLPLELAGALTLNFISGNTPLYYGHTLKILTAEDGITGTFDSVTSSDPNIRMRTFFNSDNTEFDVLLAPTSYALMAQNANQTNVAVALNSFISATSGDQLTVATALDELTASQYPAAFNCIMPQLYQSLSTIAFNIANANNMQLLQQLWVLRAIGSGFTVNGFPENIPFFQEATSQEEHQPKNDILIPSPNKHWGVFIDGNGIFAKANSGNMLPSYNAESGGVTTGLSYQWNERLLTGLYSGYQGVYTKYQTNPQGTLIDNAVRFGLFGSYGEQDGQGFYLSGLVGGAYNNYNMQRTISFGSINRTATGMPGAGELDTMLGTGYNIKRGNFTFGPSSSLQYLYFGANSFNEGGADSLNLNVQSWNTSSMIYSLGSQVAYSWKVNRNLEIIPSISLNWQHQFLQNSFAINSTLNGSGPCFANYSNAPLRDTFFPNVGLKFNLGKNWDTSLSYSSSVGNQTLASQNIFWNLGMRF